MYKMEHDDLKTEGVNGDAIYNDRVVKFARIKWNLSPNSFIDWDTLTFQATNNEGDARAKRDEFLENAYQAILKEKEDQEKEAEALAKKTNEVWKYTIDLTRGKEPQEFKMPKGAKILAVKDHITFDNRLNIHLWVQVDPDVEERVPRQITVVGTGHSVPVGADYLGTAFFGQGVVLHVWETFKP